MIQNSRQVTNGISESSCLHPQTRGVTSPKLPQLNLNLSFLMIILDFGQGPCSRVGSDKTHIEIADTFIEILNTPKILLPVTQNYIEMEWRLEWISG